MSKEILEHLKARYYGLLEAKTYEVRKIVREAHEGGVTLHIVCRSRKEYSEAMRQLGDMQGVQIGSVIDQTPVSALRVRWSDMVSQTAYSDN